MLDRAVGAIAGFSVLSTLSFARVGAGAAGNAAARAGALGSVSTASAMTVAVAQSHSAAPANARLTDAP